MLKSTCRLYNNFINNQQPLFKLPTDLQLRPLKFQVHGSSITLSGLALRYMFTRSWSPSRRWPWQQYFLCSGCWLVDYLSIFLQKITLLFVYVCKSICNFIWLPILIVFQVHMPFIEISKHFLEELNGKIETLSESSILLMDNK